MWFRRSQRLQQCGQKGCWPRPSTQMISFEARNGYSCVFPAVQEPSVRWAEFILLRLWTSKISESLMMKRTQKRAKSVSFHCSSIGRRQRSDASPTNGSNRLLSTSKDSTASTLHLARS